MFWLFLKVRWRLFLEERRINKRFAAFRPLNLAFKRAYRFKNPYAISRKFLQKKGEREVHLYGETYLTTYDTLARRIGLKESDHFLELGSGRGRGALFLSAFYGATVHGIEWIPEFVGIAQKLASEQKLPRVTFSCEDFLHADLKGYNYIYLYGTCLHEDDIHKLITRFEALPEDVTIITVSYPLTDYSPHFQLQGQLTAPFPWGATTLYLQQSKK